MGIVVDHSNTRRFVFDERKEIYYRAEVQNRVYKRELVELDQQIARLERLLELPLTPYSMLTEELFYLLPESKVDGTPPCLKRFRKERERCNSISDGGEGVVIDVSENDDILMEMTFPSVNQKPLSNKRYSSDEKTTSNSNNSTLQILTRSLSIARNGSRERKQKTGRALLKSNVPFCLTESNVLSKKRNSGPVKIGQTYTGNANSISDIITYLHSEKSPKFDKSRLEVGKSISVQDKITQASNKSIFNVNSGIVGNSAECKNKRESVRNSYNNTNDDHLFCDTSNYIHPQLINSNYIHPQLINSNNENLFAVQRIQVESMDSNSNSMSDGDDSEEETKESDLSKSNEIIFSNITDDKDYRNLRQETFQRKAAAGINGSNVSYYSLPVVNILKQGNEVNPHHSFANQRLNEYKECTSLSVYQLNHQHLEPPVRQRSLSTPNSLTSTPNPLLSIPNPLTSTPNPLTSTSNFNLSDSTPLVKSLQTTNISSPALRNTLPHTVCLNHCCGHCLIKSHTASDSISLCNSNSNQFLNTHTLSRSEQTSKQKSIISFKQHKSKTSHNIPLPSLTFNTSSLNTDYAKHKRKPSSAANQEHASGHTEFLLKPVITSLKEYSLTPPQIYPSDSQHNDIPAAYQHLSTASQQCINTDSKIETSTNHRISPETSPVYSKDQSSLENTIHPVSRSLSHCLKMNSTKQVLQAERRRKIQKLQDGLVKIQQELQDLNDLEHNFSEV